MTHDDEILNALRDIARVEQAELAASTPRAAASPDAALIDRFTDLAMIELAAQSSLRAGSARSIAARRWARRTGWFVPVLAAAAAVVLWRAPTPEPIAAYRVEVVLGEERAIRSADHSTAVQQPSLTFYPGLPFELALRPATQATGPLAAKLYLAEGKRLRLLPVQVEISPLGMVHLAGKLPARLAALPAMLWAVVARPDAFPSEDVLGTAGQSKESPTHPAWQAFRIEIREALP